MADEKTPEEKKAEEDKAAAEALKKAEDEKQKVVPHQAFHEEREKRKEAEAKLKKMEDDRVAAEKKAEEEKGNFKKLYEDEQVKNKTLMEQLTGATTKLTSFEEISKTRINNTIESIKVPEDKEMVLKILEGKTPEQQEALLPGLIKKFEIPANINAGPKDAGGKKENITDKETLRQEAEKKGDVMGLIANAPTVGQ
ncbi:MAG: hypothetical protein V4549_03525 [Bacteroidota bacterium]